LILIAKLILSLLFMLLNVMITHTIKSNRLDKIKVINCSVKSNQYLFVKNVNTTGFNDLFTQCKSEYFVFRVK
jgi:hypothetical protein